MKTLPWLSTSAGLGMATALLLSSCAVAAGSAGDDAIAVTNVRTPVPAGPNAAVYLTLTNESDTADRLVGASADAAESVALHETQIEDGSVRMRQLDGIAIPAGGETILEPGGYHVMLIDVDRELAEGDTLELTLSFEHAGDRQVTAPVVPLGEQPEPRMDQGGTHTELGG